MRRKGDIEAFSSCSSSTKRWMSLRRSTWESAKKKWWERKGQKEEAEEREIERVTILPNGAGFCNAFLPDYTNDQFWSSLRAILGAFCLSLSYLPSTPLPQPHVPPLSLTGFIPIYSLLSLRLCVRVLQYHTHSSVKKSKGGCDIEAYAAAGSRMRFPNANISQSTACLVEEII